MDDKEIIALYFARSEKAITETAQKYGRLIKSIAYNILNNSSDSEECENDTYHITWEKIPPLVPNSFSAFLGRIARNIALNRYDYYTANKRNREFETVLTELETILSDKQNPETKYELHETADHISTFLKSKSYTKRIVFVRRYFYCDTIEEIAKNYGFSESKVKSMLMRMRKELKKYLERNGITI